MLSPKVLEICILVMVLGPIVGNLLELILRRLGAVKAADIVAAVTPFAVRASSAAVKGETLPQIAREVGADLSSVVESAKAAPPSGALNPPPAGANGPAAPLMVLLLFVLAPTLHGCGAGGLSPKDAASLGLDVTDAVCDQLDEKLQDEPDWMKFSCQAVDTATQLKHVFMAKVKRENAAEFAMRHKANPCTEDAEVAP